MLVGCGSSAPAPNTPVENTGEGEAPPAIEIVGTHVAPHSIEVVCNDPSGWCTEGVEDTMVVRDAGEGRIAVEIALLQTNAHSCTFEGTLEPVRGQDGAWHMDELAEGEWPCALDLRVEGETLRLTSEGCRLYCGARASLDATFPWRGSP